MLLKSLQTTISSQPRLIRCPYMTPALPSQGYMVGNPVTDDAIDGNGQVEFAYGMGLIDPVTYRELNKACHGNYWNATQGKWESYDKAAF